MAESESAAANELIVVLCTAPPPQAPLLARLLVEEGLAACVNIVEGIHSVYRWDGRICDDAESLLVVKARRAGFEALRARLAAAHPYEVPEIIALPLVAGHAPYLEWALASGGAGPRPPAED